MKVVRFKGKTSGTMIELTTEEAISIIASLATQIKEGSSNVGRTEYTDDEGKYFSIAVWPRGRKP